MYSQFFYYLNQHPIFIYLNQFPFFIYLKQLAHGLPVTLSLSFFGIISAGILAVLLCVLLSLHNRIISGVINIYTMIFTGTPLLVQIFLIYYGPTQFDVIKESPWLWHLLSSPWFCAYLALMLNSGAYTTIIFYGSLKAVPNGMLEACSALGMTRAQTLKVILPYALKRALSTYSNEIIFVVKGSALASTITLMDVMGYYNFLNGRYYDFTIFIATGFIYLVINGLLSLFMRLIEKRALRFEYQ